jgi:hypothetical protein
VRPPSSRPAPGAPIPAAGKGAYGVPVSVLDDAYGKATVELANRLDEYFTMDV